MNGAQSSINSSALFAALAHRKGFLCLNMCLTKPSSLSRATCLDIGKISSPGRSGEVFFLDIPFYRTRLPKSLVTESNPTRPIAPVR